MKGMAGRRYMSGIQFSLSKISLTGSDEVLVSTALNAARNATVLGGGL